MNMNLPDRVQNNLNEIYRLLGVQPFEFFPVRYESPVRLRGRGLIV